MTGTTLVHTVHRLAGLVGVALSAIVVAAWGAAPARASWKLHRAIRASIAYNQGATFDASRREFFFDGVTSTSNSGLYRTTASLVQTASNTAVIPTTREGYNHAGDLSFDPLGRRVLLPLECYYPSAGGNTCGTGAIGVADPRTLRLLYYVNLDRAQIQKAMWVEISPDGRWIWTSSGTHLLVYRAADVNPTIAERQRGGADEGIMARDLGSVLPSSGVTGATFYEDASTRFPKLLLALNRGTYSELISYSVGTASDGAPRLLSGSLRSEITIPRSSSDNEPEGLTATAAGILDKRSGGGLDWLMLPALTPTSLFARLLGFLPSPAPPRDGAEVPARQRLQPVLFHGLRVRVVCNHPCTITATAAIGGTLARCLGLVSKSARLRTYTVAAGNLAHGRGARTLIIKFPRRFRGRLGRERSLKLSVLITSVDVLTRRAVTQKLNVRLTR